jgi:tetratricopeptide (TPR) repeat protein
LLSGLGVLALDQGHTLQAEGYLRESLQCARAIGNQQAICNTLGNLNEALCRQGHWAEAEETLQEGLSLARELGHREHLCSLLRRMGQLALQQGHMDQAEAIVQEGIALARASQHHWHLGALLGVWGDVHLACQQWDAAQAAYMEAVEMAEEMKGNELEAAARYGLARLAAHRGNLEEARRQGERSIQLYGTHHLFEGTEVKHWLARLSSLAAKRTRS